MRPVATWSAWPAGFGLVLAQSAGLLLPAALYVVLDVAYLVAVVIMVRSTGSARDRASSTLATVGAGAFALVALLGRADARHPGPMLLTSSLQLVVAIVVLGAAARLAMRSALQCPPSEHCRRPAGLGVLALLLATGGHLVDLIGRWIVMASAGVSGDAEAAARVAVGYVPGAAPAPSVLGYAIVLLDLLQVACVVLTFLGFGGLAVALGRAGGLSPFAARHISRAGYWLAGLVAAATVLPMVLPGTPHSMAMWTSFVLAAPLLSTLLPYVTGVALIGERARGGGFTITGGAHVTAEPVV
jgi:hypothetical protein